MELKTFFSPKVDETLQNDDRPILISNDEPVFLSIYFIFSNPFKMFIQIIFKWANLLSPKRVSILLFCFLLSIISIESTSSNETNEL